MDPQFAPDYIFEAKRLAGVKEPPRVLKPGDQPVDLTRGRGRGGRGGRGGFGFGDRGGGSRGEGDSYRPVTGFMQNLPNVASVGPAGHRFIQ